MKLETTRREYPLAAPRAALWSLAWLSAAFLAALAFSCSGGDEGTGKSSKRKPKAKAEEETAVSGDLDELQATAQELLAKAKKAGLATSLAEDFEGAAAQIKDAEKLLEDGNEAKAKTKLNLATRRLKSLLEERDRVAEALKKLGDVRKAAEDAKKKAEGAKAQENAQDLYKQAMEAYASAVAALDKAAEVRAVDGARQNLIRAKDTFDQATSMAAENATFRDRALKEQKECAIWKKKAQEKGAEEKAMSDWLSASQTEREAESLLQTGEFRQGLEAYKDATKRYSQALETVVGAEAMQKMQDDLGKRDAEYAQRLEAERALAKEQATANGEEATAEEDPKPAPGPIIVQPPPTAPPEGSEPVTLFEGFEASKYPQELDAEDEAFLQLNYKKLLKSSCIEYDPTTGGVLLNYAVGKDVQADHVQVYPLQKDFISFKDPMMDMKRLSEEDKKKMAPFSFAGNTRGFITFPVPFRYYVRVEWDMGILTMDKSGTFTCVLNYDPQKKTGFATEWLRLGVLQGMLPQIKKPVGRAPYDMAADRWFDKKRAVPMVVEFKAVDDPKKPDAQGTKSGIFKCVYDAGGDEEASNSMPGGQYKGGYVGFQWNRTKFQVRDLRITGVLDKKAAVALLRKKLGIKKEGTGEKAAADEEPTTDKKTAKKTTAKKAPAKKPAAETPKEEPAEETPEEKPAEKASGKAPEGEEAKEAPAEDGKAAEDPAEPQEEGKAAAEPEAKGEEAGGAEAGASTEEGEAAGEEAPPKEKKKATKSTKKPFDF